MKFNFVGYGSLLSHKSLSETISNKKFTSIIIKGYKRIFNLNLRKDENFDVLNLEKSPRSSFNAVMFKINEEELKLLSKREDEYNLEETVAYDFKTGKKIGKCLVFVDYLIDIDKKKKLPGKKYFQLCREAAYKISKKFGKMWDETTYTSDNEKISNWIKDNKSYDRI